MASTLADIDALANNAAFAGRVTSAVLYVGTGIIKDIMDAGNATPLDKARMRLARAAIADPVGYGTQFTRVLAVQPAIIDTSTDTQIVNIVTAAWNYLAEVNL